MTTIATATIQASELERGDLIVCGAKFREVLASEPHPTCSQLHRVRLSDRELPNLSVLMPATLTVLIRDRAVTLGGDDDDSSGGLERYELPALIVVDANSRGAAHKSAGELARTLIQDTGPGAFFLNVAAVPIGAARPCQPDRSDETIGSHVRSIMAASPISYISP